MCHRLGAFVVKNMIESPPTFGKEYWDSICLGRVFCSRGNDWFCIDKSMFCCIASYERARHSVQSSTSDASWVPRGV